MDAARSSDDPRTARDVRIDGLRAEASEAVGYSANTLRAVRQRYRTQYAEEFSRWQALRDELDAVERGPSAGRGQDPNEPARAAEAGAEAERVRALRSEVEGVGAELGRQQAEVARLEIALRSLESMWLFLERGDASLVNDGQGIAADVEMRIVEAQEAERSRLAHEVHDGPAQSLSNAIFQVEYIERVLDTDPPSARKELSLLTDLLQRELGSVRTFISQLRPPILDELGLDGALLDAIGRTAAQTGLAITTGLDAPTVRLTGTQRTVALRVLQEALQNVRKHAAASSVRVSTGIEPDVWVLTITDDGRGFDVGAVAARGRRNFGLQFMRERAELIGAQFEVHSRPDGGTIVRLAIPLGTEEST